MSNKNRKPIPRLVPTKVGLFESRLMLNLPYGQMTDTLDPRRGLAAVQQFMCASRPLSVWSTKSLPGGTTLVGKLDKTFPNNSGFWSLDDSLASEAQTTGSFQLDNSSFINFVGIWTYNDEADSQGRLSHRALDSNGLPFFGIPFEFDPASDNLSITLTVVSSGPMPTNVLTVQMVSALGTVDAAFNIPNTSPSFSGNVAVPVKTTLGGRYACCLPSTPLGFRLKCSVNLNLVDLRIEVQQVAGTTLGRFDFIQAPISKDITHLYNDISVVGGGLYMSYMGSSLLNGGDTSTYMWRGGFGSSLDGLNSVAQIGESLDGHNNPLKSGNYCVLQPSTIADLEFYSRTDVQSSLSLSQQIIYLNIADLTQNRPVRLYSFLLCEGTSNSPLIKLETAPAIPGGTAAYIVGINRFPDRVDNPLHWKDIKEFGKSLFAKGQHAVAWYNSNSSWINPMLGAIAAAVI